MNPTLSVLIEWRYPDSVWMRGPGIEGRGGGGHVGGLFTLEEIADTLDRKLAQGCPWIGVSA